MAWIELHQELREHRKIYACAEILKISRVTMVGTIISLWLWALDNMPDGSLQGVSNRTIARVCDFPEKKADSLVKALIDTGWLDNMNGILSIHDWNEYTGKLMDRRKKDRERKKKSAQLSVDIHRDSAGNPPEVRANSCATVQYSTKTVPNHIISAHNTTPDIAAEESTAPKYPTSFDGQSFSSFWNAYPDGPGKISREATYSAWKAIAPSKETAGKILSALEAWKKSSRWLDNGGAFVPSAANFLTKGYWKTTPAPAEKKSNPAYTSRKLDEEEREAIRRMLADSEEVAT